MIDEGADVLATDHVSIAVTFCMIHPVINARMVCGVHLQICCFFFVGRTFDSNEVCPGSFGRFGQVNPDKNRTRKQKSHFKQRIQRQIGEHTCVCTKNECSACDNFVTKIVFQPLNLGHIKNQLVEY